MPSNQSPDFETETLWQATLHRVRGMTPHGQIAGTDILKIIRCESADDVHNAVLKQHQSKFCSFYTIEEIEIYHVNGVSLIKDSFSDEQYHTSKNLPHIFFAHEVFDTKEFCEIGSINQPWESRSDDKAKQELIELAEFLGAPLLGAELVAGKMRHKGLHTFAKLADGFFLSADASYMTTAAALSNEYADYQLATFSDTNEQKIFTDMDFINSLEESGILTKKQHEFLLANYSPVFVDINTKQDKVYSAEDRAVLLYDKGEFKMPPLPKPNNPDLLPE